MVSILVIEDDESQRLAMEEFLGNLEGGAFTVYSAPDGELAHAVLDERPIDFVISDLMLPDTTGIEILKKARESYPTLPFLILTGQPTIETAIDAIRAGADDYLMKPVDLTLLKSKVSRFVENIRLKEENKNLRARLSETFNSESIIGNAPALRQTLERVRQVAPTDVTVLIEGESGTGKEMVANVIHENSKRADKPFIKVNCGALTKTILESELFGAVKGAYTGSEKDRAGYFEAADGGTIFLDEIGEMDPESQVRLLRVIEEREVVRVGSSTPIKVDVRILAATNRNLLTQAEEGDFREDLYYRLAVIRMRLPSLRERAEDIPLLFNFFITRFNDKYEKSVTGLSPDLLKFFQTYDWPGNIRQFRNIVEGMAVLATEDILQKDELPEELKSPRARTAAGKSFMDSISSGVSLEEYEKAIITKNLAYTGGNREKTANLLGISERTLYRKIKEYDIR